MKCQPSPTSPAWTMDDFIEKPENKRPKYDDSIANPSPQTDLISNLPEPIMHHCLSFLPAKDVIRTSILSKKWKSIWNSFPILDFDQAAFEKSLYAKYSLLDICLQPPELKEMFLKYLSRSIRRWDKILSLQKFRLVADLQGRQSDGRLNTAIKFAVQNGVRDLELSISRKHYKFFDPPVSLYFAKSVTVLKLTNFKAELDNLIQGSPLIEELRLRNSQVPQDIRLLSDKLKTVELIDCSEVKNLAIEAINLHCFRYHGGYNSCNPSFTTCKSLKMLSLEIRIEHQWLEDVISQLFLLETLELRIFFELKRIKVLHQQLRSLKLHVFEKFEIEIEIDTPKLRYFSYHGKPVRFGLFKASALLDASLSLYEPLVKSGQWFANPRELLRLFGHCKVLNLICDWPQDLCFTEELREICVSPLSNLKHLQVEFSRVEFVQYAKLVDTLLWLSPHLQTMPIASGHRRISLKFEHEMVQNGELFCCGVHPEDCWKYHLKKLILVSFCGNNDDKEDLFMYFRQSAKSLETIQDDSLYSALP